ncbi:methionyl-tRNA formyltransferase [Spiroplasma endosymbiont of Amphibalanus improvisus]|uniref:methionyl-tRNA formyltransferase n=1 Tax=Spiroplasma endosymbiont of Amphibalanus improvisus TaxID=3066327 RepID=UPI003CC7A7A6
MGTPSIACHILQALNELPFIELVLVVSQPVRNKKKNSPPVEKLATTLKLNIEQPDKVIEIYDVIAELKPDVIITCAYGQFLPKKIINLAKNNILNFHASLLPKYRGGAPIHKAIINGETKTGISIMQTVAKMDAGDVYVQDSIIITDDDTNLSLNDKLGNLGYDMCQKYLQDILEHKIQPVPQDIKMVTYAYNIVREEEKIDWNKSVIEIHNLIRGLYDNPIAYTKINDQIIYKIHQARVYSHEVLSEIKNGTIYKIIKEGILVKCVDGLLLIIASQREGKKKVLCSNYFKNENNEIKINNCFN